MMRRLELADDQFLAYDDRGDRDAPPVVLLHGGGLDHRMWAPQLDALVDPASADPAPAGHRVIAPDARAHGESSTPDQPYRLVDDVVALLDALELDRVVVVGLSMGGGTAVDLAVERPDRVRGLVVSGTGTSDPRFTDPWVLEILGLWQSAAETGDPERWVEGFQRFVPGPHRRPDQVDPQVLEACGQMVRHTLARHVLPVVARGRAPVQPTPVDRVNERRGAIVAPVLALTGALDADDHRRLTRELLDQVPDGREVVVPESAHYPNLEEPETFDEALVAFVRDLDRT